MNVTLTLDDALVRAVRRIAAERDASLSGLIHAHLEQLVAEDARPADPGTPRQLCGRPFRAAIPALDTPRIWPEDLNPSQGYFAIEVVNPFVHCRHR